MKKCAKNAVADLWQKKIEIAGDRMSPNVKCCKTPLIMPVAATRAKSISCVYLKMVIRDREVGGSNPLAPTIKSHLIKYLRPPVWAACFLVVADLWQALFR
jgi:hypothetical protein